jgi:hypothetical protein
MHLVCQTHGNTHLIEINMTVGCVVGITLSFSWELRNPTDAHFVVTVYTFTREMPTNNLADILTIHILKCSFRS